MVDFVLVDMGYLLFYRYHATIRWLSFQKDGDLSDDNVKRCFAKHLTSMLEKLKKKYKNATFYFCKDEKHNEVWRKQLYSDYKATRASATTMIYELQHVLVETLASFGKIRAGLGLEADDVVYLTVKKLRNNEATKDAEIVIITSDHDYLQMLDDNISIVDGGGKPIEGTGDPEVDLWIKILMGDSSDNIPPVCKGCGKKTAEALARNPLKREEYIKKNNCREQVERNRRLISMECIPANLANAFYENVVW